jgi:hypothetical protein
MCVIHIGSDIWIYCYSQYSYIRHISSRYFRIKDCFERKQVQMHYLPSYLSQKHQLLVLKYCDMIPRISFGTHICFSKRNDDGKFKLRFLRLPFGCCCRIKARWVQMPTIVTNGSSHWDQWVRPPPNKGISSSGKTSDNSAVKPWNLPESSKAFYETQLAIIRFWMC